MCARRNPKSHAKLVGSFAQCDRNVPKWRGNYPQGMDADEFAQAQAIRSQMWAAGSRQAEIVDAIKSALGRPNSTERDSTSSEEPVANTLKIPALENLDHIQQFVNNWKQVKWHRELKIVQQHVELGDFGAIDIVAVDADNKVVALIEFQIDRDDIELIDSVCAYVDLLRQRMPAGVIVEGVVVADRLNNDAIKVAKNFGVIAFCPEISVTHHVTTSHQPKWKVRLKEWG